MLTLIANPDMAAGSYPSASYSKRSDIDQSKNENMKKIVSDGIYSSRKKYARDNLSANIHHRSAANFPPTWNRSQTQLQMTDSPNKTTKLLRHRKPFSMASAKATSQTRPNGHVGSAQPHHSELPRMDNIYYNNTVSYDPFRSRNSMLQQDFHLGRAIRPVTDFQNNEFTKWVSISELHKLINNNKNGAMDLKNSNVQVTIQGRTCPGIKLTMKNLSKNEESLNQKEEKNERKPPMKTDSDTEQMKPKPPEGPQKVTPSSLRILDKARLSSSERTRRWLEGLTFEIFDDNVISEISDEYEDSDSSQS